MPQKEMAARGATPRAARKINGAQIIATDNLSVKNIERWADKINLCYAISYDALVETGRQLIQCKAALPHGGWLKIFDSGQLHFGPDTAEKLMRISRHGVLSNSANSRNLPVAIDTLNLLTRVPETLLVAGIADGRVRPEMTAREVKWLVEPPAEKTSRHAPETSIEPQLMQSPMGLLDKIVLMIENIRSEKDLSMLAKIIQGRLLVLRSEGAE